MLREIGLVVYGRLPGRRWGAGWLRQQRGPAVRLLHGLPLLRPLLLRQLWPQQLRLLLLLLLLLRGWRQRRGPLREHRRLHQLPQGVVS